MTFCRYCEFMAEVLEGLSSVMTGSAMLWGSPPHRRPRCRPSLSMPGVQSAIHANLITVMKAMLKTKWRVRDWPHFRGLKQPVIKPVQGHGSHLHCNYPHVISEMHSVFPAQSLNLHLRPRRGGHGTHLEIQMHREISVGFFSAPFVLNKYGTKKPWTCFTFGTLGSSESIFQTIRYSKSLNPLGTLFVITPVLPQAIRFHGDEHHLWMVAIAD